MAKVLVVGGAGYVGGTACAWLLDRGHEVWVLDDFSTGHRQLIDRLKKAGSQGISGFVEARAGDAAVVAPFLARERFDCVMHFAAFASVAESVAQPDLYFENNVVQTRSLLESMLAAGTRRFIFSSTCAIFGDPGPTVERLHENLPKSPVNPYGATKLEVENTLAELSRSRGLQAVALRYFNAAGAEPQGRVGEWHEPETHLIPRILKAALKNEPVEIYGTDYPTPDGTAVRDYVHVSDLAQAHEAAMLRLMEHASEPKGRFEAYNLGSASGYSVKQMIEACERAIGRKLKKVERPRRAGDPPSLIGDSTLAQKVLGFKPSADSLDRIFASAWKWEQGLEVVVGSRKAVFLDRDGTINLDPGYLSDPAQMQLLPEAGGALASLKKAGFKLIVISNQSGVGRGKIVRDTLPLIHARMEELLGPYGVSIDHYGLCFHRPEEDCECRKPKPKLLIDTARALGVDITRSYMVGDKHSDLHAGHNAGCRASLLVRTGHGADTEPTLTAGEAHFIADSLSGAAQWILAQET
jgi:UDP-glucose 4-epimerase